MASQETKAKNYLAKFHAFSNAAEMIGSHGEEGFGFEDNKFNKAYLRQCQSAKNHLMKIADNHLKKYRQIGIDIDDTIEEGAGYL